MSWKLASVLAAGLTTALNAPSRRHLLVGGGASLVGGPALALDLATQAAPPGVDAGRSMGRSGLLLLPPVAPLRNSYTWVRAGEDALEASDVIATNSAFKMAVSNSLTAAGERQAVAAARALASRNVDPLIWYCTGRSSTQTAEIIAAELSVGSDRLKPEYVMLDARGFGAHEGSSLRKVEELHAAYDGKSRYLRPVEGEDGSYAESVEDVYARIRSVLSNCETTKVGEEIVIVAPGADMATIANAMLYGADLRTHFEGARVGPGALLRFGDMASTARPWATRPSTNGDPGVAWANEERTRLTTAWVDKERAAGDLYWARSEAARRGDLGAASAEKSAAASKKAAESADRTARLAADRALEAKERRRRADAAAADAVAKRAAADAARPAAEPVSALEELAWGAAAAAGAGALGVGLSRAPKAEKPVRAAAPAAPPVLAIEPSAKEAAHREVAAREAADRAAASAAAVAAAKAAAVAARPPPELIQVKEEVAGPCDPLDEICIANYANEDDSAWLSEISSMLADEDDDVEAVPIATAGDGDAPKKVVAHLCDEEDEACIAEYATY